MNSKICFFIGATIKITVLMIWRKPKNWDFDGVLLSKVENV